jgi:selenide,water dikinase
MDDKIPLTHLSHKSGCGSKLSPQILHALLGTGPLAGEYPDLLVGYNTMDDAAIYQIDPGQAIVATADFLTPIVNDPYQFGQIAAASALSDVYAMGGRPTFALALLGFPGLLIPVEAARKILEGGAAMCKQAGIPICGGHSIDSPEIFYGLSVIGTVHPDAIVRNSTASPGDVIILTKALGMGVFAEAIRRGEIDPKAYKIREVRKKWFFHEHRNSELQLL